MPEEPIAIPIKLPEEIAKALREQEAVIEDTRRKLAALKEVGLDTKPIEDKLDWADNARKVMLKEFT